jgi:glucokinase
MGSYAGVDLGATKIKVVVGDEQARILGEHRRATPPGPTGIDVTEAVLETLRAACSDAGIDPTALEAVGIGSFGPFDMAEGAVDNPANLPDSVERIPLVGPVENLIGAERVYLHNDTNAGVIGERFHSERNPDSMAYLTISSGIGAGVCVDGNVLDGWDGNAGEVGHWIVDPQGQLTCGCGRDGHWEAYCSGENIPEYARLLAEAFEGESAIPFDDPGFSAKDVFAHADSDPLAEHVVDQVAHWNAIGVTNLVQAYAPLSIHLGGAVALNNEAAVVDPLREAMDDLVFSNVPDIRLTEFGEDVVVRGALASALTGGTGDRSRR